MRVKTSEEKSQNLKSNPVETEDVQTQSDGAGPMYHRVYAVDIPVGFEAALKTMKEVMVDPNTFSPPLIARFEKTKGAQEALGIGDEFMVHLPSPWQAPVRVSQVGESSFTLLTLEGHIEAGQIQFRLTHGTSGRVRFEIESVTRSKDRIVNFFYDTLRVAQFAQTEMWERFCKSFAEKSFEENGLDPKDLPPVEIKTERQDRTTGVWLDVSGQLGAQTIV